MDLIVFLGLAALMLLLSLILILPSLMRRSRGDGSDRQQQNIDIAREQLAALQREHDDGLLTERELKQARADLEQTLMQDLNASAQTADGRSGGRWVALPVIVFVPVMTVGLYLALGNLPVLIPQAGAPEQTQVQDLSPQDIEQMVARLDQRLQQQPDDLQGWLMLGRSYMVLESYNEAAEAFRQLHQRVGDEPRVMMLYADALAMAQQGSISGRPLELIERVLVLEPGHITARWMKGVALRQQGLIDKALVIWQELLSEDGLDARVREQLQQMVEQSGGQVAAAATTSTEVANPASAAASLQVSVSIDPILAADLPGDTPVFVLARAIEGPRAPLAVSRHQLDELPLTIDLNDSMAMTDALKLSAFKQVSVIARVAVSGQPIAQSGDIQGLFGPVTVGNGGTVEIFIDKVVE